MFLFCYVFAYPFYSQVTKKWDLALSKDTPQDLHEVRNLEENTVSPSFYVRIIPKFCFDDCFIDLLFC